MFPGPSLQVSHGVDWDGVAVFMSESPFSSFFTNNAQELSNYTGNFSYTGGTSVSADGTNTGYCIYNSTSNFRWKYRYRRAQCGNHLLCSGICLPDSGCFR